MKLLLVLSGICVALLSIDTGAQAQNYPWCAIYGDIDGGGTNCGFTTFEQCMVTARGLGSNCQPNTQYQPPLGPHQAIRAQRRYPH